MRKTLAILGALVLCATPAAAQRSGPSAQVESTPAPAVQQAEPARSSLFPTTDEVRAQVRANEQDRASRDSAAMTQRDWLYLVAAIAVGVIVAFVVLD